MWRQLFLQLIRTGSLLKRLIHRFAVVWEIFAGTLEHYRKQFAPCLVHVFTSCTTACKNARASDRFLQFVICQNLSQATCCKMLREITTMQKFKTRPPLNQRHMSKRLKWERKYKNVLPMWYSLMNAVLRWIAISVVICWISFDHRRPVSVCHQQGREGVMWFQFS